MADRVQHPHDGNGGRSGARYTSWDRGGAVEDAGTHGPPDPIPETDDEVTADAWATSGAMEGEAPTG